MQVACQCCKTCSLSIQILNTQKQKACSFVILWPTFFVIQMFFSLAIICSWLYTRQSGAKLLKFPSRNWQAIMWINTSKNAFFWGPCSTSRSQVALPPPSWLWWWCQTQAGPCWGWGPKLLDIIIRCKLEKKKPNEHAIVNDHGIAKQWNLSIPW